MEATAFWITLTVTFGLLSLGPFIHFAGDNTHIPVRGRWSAIFPLFASRVRPRGWRSCDAGYAVLFAVALRQLGERWPHRRRAMLSTWPR